MTAFELRDQIEENLPHVKIEQRTEMGAFLDLDPPGEGPPIKVVVASAEGDKYTVLVQSIEGHQVLNLLESMTRRMSE